jgi:hypothetical protein
VCVDGSLQGMPSYAGLHHRVVHCLLSQWRLNASQGSLGKALNVLHLFAALLLDDAVAVVGSHLALPLQVVVEAVEGQGRFGPGGTMALYPR